MSDLRTVIADYTDEYLCEEFNNHSESYTPEALAIMKDEISRRGLAPDGTAVPADEGRTEPEGPVSLDNKDFEKFEHAFTHIDLLLASNVLRDRNIPFFPDNPQTTTTFPLQGESDALYTIRVHKDRVQEAHELLDEHFVKEENRYRLKYTAAKDRLKSFNFHDVRDSGAGGELNVSFTPDEKLVIIALGKRLLKEADKIEQTQERVLFYYDAVEPLLERLESGADTLSRADLLAMLEILQVYVDELQANFDDTIEALLSFVMQG
ncbi:MAG: hypothetical protein MUF22_07925 [Chitinispirillaceae bacterium]|jgi:hypothetical protein|nr:hypothetical protein [Chitinispirillaceae bacterium]